MALLDTGDRFPDLPFTPVGGTTVALLDLLRRPFGVVLFNRGAWCPYCNAQLAAFQRASDRL